MDRFRAVVAAFFCGALALQAQTWQVGGFVGGRFGGSLNIESQSVPNFHANIADGIAYGLNGGHVFDADDCRNCNLVEFRWMHASTNLQLPQDPFHPGVASTFHPSLTMDHFLGDFTHEWPSEDYPALRPFLTGTLGAVRMAGPASSTTRFVFGIGAGLKIFPAPHWGVQIQAEYLPIVLHASLQTLVCTTGCLVVLNGGVANQFQVSIGPLYRF
jgi:hypothetical protein